MEMAFLKSLFLYQVPRMEEQYSMLVCCTHVTQSHNLTNILDFNIIE